MEFREYTIDSLFDYRDLNRWKSNLMELTTEAESFKQVTIDRNPLNSRLYTASMRMHASDWNEPFQHLRKIYEVFPYLPLTLRRDYEMYDVLLAEEFNRFEEAIRYLASYIEGNQQYFYAGEVYSGGI